MPHNSVYSLAFQFNTPAIVYLTTADDVNLGPTSSRATDPWICVRDGEQDGSTGEKEMSTAQEVLQAEARPF
jgi:hypothetical protein